VPKNYYYHDKCEAPGPTCSTCGYKRGHDYYQAMVEEWAKTEDAQLADGQWYTPADREIECNQTFTGFVKLNSDLICTELNTTSGIVLEGPSAFLDCADFFIRGPRDDGRGNSPEEVSIGITLKDGATAINCNVIGFYKGVLMEDGNIVLKDSTVALAYDDNIRTEGDGCMVLDKVTSQGASGTGNFFGGTADGLDIRHSGTINIYKSTFNGNAGDGVDSEDLATLPGLCLHANNVVANFNEGNGYALDHPVGQTDLKMVTGSFNGDFGVSISPFLDDDPDHTANVEDVVAIGNGEKGIRFRNLKEANIYGTMTSNFNGNDGFEIVCDLSDECTVNDLGVVTLEGNLFDGLFFSGSNSTTFNVKPCATVQACGNEIVSGTDVEFDATDPTTVNGDIICDTTGNQIPNFECQRGCTPAGSGTICQSPVHAYCYPKPEDW